MTKIRHKAYRIYRRGSYVGTYGGTNPDHAIGKHAKDEGFDSLEDMLRIGQYDRSDFTTRRPGDLLRKG